MSFLCFVFLSRYLLTHRTWMNRYLQYIHHDAPAYTRLFSAPNFHQLTSTPFDVVLARISEAFSYNQSFSLFGFCQTLTHIKLLRNVVDLLS